MIKIKNLTKIYISKRVECKAIDNISFSLPNKGLVFIIGKSGSGKSTLLNILGGLDNLTSGDIYIYDKQLSNFKSKDFNSYRNDFLGFVFQDFHLIDELNVYQNIELSLNLKGKEDSQLIKNTLDKVGLAGYENRYISELSGGQKQRVAIARALVKQPKMILADEPTGNLDKKTSVQILELLKEISKSSLVVVVSHNLNDASKYGDRIIELSDGRVVSDVVREDNYDNNFKITDGVVNLPYNKELTSEELNLLKKKVSKNEIKDFKQISNGFIKHKEDNNDLEETDTLKWGKSKIKFTKIFGISSRFLKKHLISYILTTLMISFLIILFGLSQLFVDFDSKNTINNVMKDSLHDSIVLEKGYYVDYDLKDLSRAYMVEVNDDDLDILDKDYPFNKYKLYNYILPVSGSSWHVYSQTKISSGWNFSNFYVKEMYGTLLTDEEYLTRLYNVNGKLEVLAGDIHDEGIIITDYIADAMLHYKFTNAYGYENETYQDLIGDMKAKNNSKYGTISAIINTGYKKKYESLKTDFDKITSSINSKKELKEFIARGDFLEFCNEVKYYLGIGYCLNEKYIEEIQTGVHSDLTAITNASVCISDEICTNVSSIVMWNATNMDMNLKDNEIAITYTTYNSIFKTNYNSNNIGAFVPHTIKLKQFPKYMEDEMVYDYEVELKIAELTAGTHAASKDVYDILAANNIIPYAIYLDDASKIGGIHETIIDLGYYVDSLEYSSVTSIVNVISVFEELFSTIIVFIIIIAIMLIIFFANYNIRKNMFNIGVIKALGGSTKDVLKIFSLQVLLVGLCSAIISGIGVYFLVEETNNILVESFAKIFNNDYILDFMLLEFDFIVILSDLILITLITAITSLIPLLALHKIKPMNIIRKKE